MKRLQTAVSNLLTRFSISTRLSMLEKGKAWRRFFISLSEYIFHAVSHTYFGMDNRRKTYIPDLKIIIIIMHYRNGTTLKHFRKPDTKKIFVSLMFL